VSREAVRQLDADLDRTMGEASLENPLTNNFSLGFKYNFKRTRPVGAQELEFIQSRQLNFARYHDCLATKQLDEL